MLKVYSKPRFHSGAKPCFLKPRFSITSQKDDLDTDFVLMFKWPCGCQTHKKPFVATTCRLIQYNV